MNKPLIIANWKMNPQTLKQAEKLFKEIHALSRSARRTKVLICAPAVYLAPLSKIKNSLVLGAQDVHEEKDGAHTGGVSASMLKDLKVSHVIIGHSERRAAGDTDEIVSRKLLSALKSGLVPILCVGESHRDEKGDYHLDIKGQIMRSLAGFPKSKLSALIIAYEPLWAIGKNALREATPEESEEMAIFIRKVLSDMYDARAAGSVQVIYGGSVNAENAGHFLARGGVAGLLVGRESLTPKKFAKIIQLASL